MDERAMSLPANPDAERTVLGAILLDNQAFTEASEHLDAGDWSLDSHRRIFRRMAQLISLHQTVDIVTLSNELSRHKEVEAVGGVAYLAGLTEGLPRRPVIGEYVRIIKDKSLLRKTMAISNRAIEAAADQAEPALEVIGRAQADLQVLAEQGISTPLETFGDFIEKEYGGPDAVFKESKVSLGLRSGLSELDELTCGFQREELIIIGARPNAGKTALGLKFAAHAAIELDQTVAFYSLEMKRKLLLHRLVAMYGTLSLKDIDNGRWTPTTLRYRLEAMALIASAPLFVDDRKNQTIQAMKAKAARLKAQTGHLDLVVIDQLNHIPIPAEGQRYNNRTNELGVVTRSLKAMADDLNVPLIVLHQLNRANEKRGDDHEPKLSDLRDSGNVEQDADLVLFPHRPAYYDKDADDKAKKKAIVIVAKNRNGPTGRAHCQYIDEQTLFCDEGVPERTLW
jgi:replicative DNA helicase